GEFVIVSAKRNDEQPLVKAAVAAANAGDFSALGRLPLGPGVAGQMVDAVRQGGAFTGVNCIGVLDAYSMPWLRPDASRWCELTQQSGSTGWAILLLDFSFEDPWTTTWTLDAFDAEALAGD